MKVYNGETFWNWLAGWEIPRAGLVLVVPGHGCRRRSSSSLLLLLLLYVAVVVVLTGSVNSVRTYVRAYLMYVCVYLLMYVHMYVSVGISYLLGLSVWLATS